MNSLVRLSLVTWASEEQKALYAGKASTPSVRFDRPGMFEPLLQAAPSFCEKWKTFQEEYRSGDGLPLFLVLSALARHLIQDVETGSTHRFDVIFDAVKR